MNIYRKLFVFGGQLLVRYGQRGVGGCELADDFRRLSNLSLRSSSRLFTDLRLYAHVVQLRRQHR